MSVGRLPPTRTRGFSPAKPRPATVPGLSMAKMPAAVAKWSKSMLGLDPGVGATLASVLTPGKLLNTALTRAGIDPASGRSYQPAPGDAGAVNTLRPLPFVPMVLYPVNAAQLASLEKTFQLETKNAVSSALGQAANRGVVSAESYTAGTKTLWRMAVYPVKGKPGQFQVGFYGEAIPAWAKGQGFVDLHGKTLPLRLGLDTRVGAEESVVAKAWDAIVLHLGLDTK